MSRTFYDLTPDRVITAIEKQGFGLTGHYMVLNSYENRVYDLKTEAGEHVIAKFYRPGRWSREQIMEEHEFLFALQKDEIPVCAPLKFSNGESIAVEDGIFFAVWPRTGGRVCDELNNEHSETLGRLVARIHNNGSALPESKRKRLTGKSYGLDSLDFLLENKFIPELYTHRYCEAVKTVSSIYDELSRDVPLHRIHGDCHLGNLLKGVQGWFFLDFDDSITGPAVQDLWMLIPSRDEDGLRQRKFFLQGYRQFRDFDDSWLKLIEPLRALRYINYAGWIARRWDDPAFRDIFSYFGEPTFWERETKDLEDQLSFIMKEAEDPHLSCCGTNLEEQEEEEELTNKDFFWDMED